MEVLDLSTTQDGNADSQGDFVSPALWAGAKWISRKN